jgi:short-subunit dehydrogenase involved in D-alanine esterification of teichoic acids
MAPYRLKDRRILITGGGTGIGRAMARALAERGNRVLVCGRRADLIEATTRLHRNIVGAIADITDESDRDRLEMAVRNELSALDILINNAGVQHAQAYGVGRLDRSGLRGEIDINLVAPMLLVDRFLPLLRQSPAPAILNLTSLLGVIPKPNAPGYCASKAAIMTFTRALRMQFAGTPVRFVNVFPPLVDTPMTAGRGTGKMSPETFAERMIEAFEAGRDEIAVGEARNVLLFQRLIPQIAYAMMRRITRPGPNGVERLTLDSGRGERSD